MKAGIFAALISLSVLGSAAFADEDEFRELPVSVADPAGEWAPEFGLPAPPWMALEEIPRDREDGETNEFSLGPVAGYIKIRDADRGTWFGGVQARYRFLKFLAVEGSITFHQDRFQDGDVIVTQYPVQVSGLIFPLRPSAFEPYGLIGAGWYYTRVEIDTPLFEDDDTDHLFGVHVGAGAQLELSPRFAVFADFRWIFLDEPSTDNSNLREEEFDSGQVTLGGSFRF